MTQIRKAKRTLSKMLRSMNRKRERAERRSRSSVEFSSHQLSNLARMHQKLVVMGK